MARSEGHILALASRPKPAAAMVESASLIVTTDGIDGERRPGGAPSVSLLDREAWAAACTDAQAELPWTTRRANVLIEGIDLANTLGRRIRLGDVLLEVVEETKPCALMDRFHDGLRAALGPDWRGGASCRVVEPGTLRVKSAVGFAD